MSDETKPFDGRAAIVTGATRGIGRAIGLELARRGANVTFNYAKSAEAAEEMVKQTKEAFGRIDFLVNNAGVARDNLILRMKE